MIHLLAISICDEYLVKLINQTNIEQTLDIEEDTDNDSKNKPFEFDDFDDEYLVNSSSHSIYYHSSRILENFSPDSSRHLQIALPHRISKILIPPPRA